LAFEGRKAAFWRDPGACELTTSAGRTTVPIENHFQEAPPCPTP
jgi:hypothetical protein